MRGAIGLELRRKVVNALRPIVVVVAGAKVLVCRNTPYAKALIHINNPAVLSVNVCLRNA